MEVERRRLRRWERSDRVLLECAGSEATEYPEGVRDALRDDRRSPDHCRDGMEVTAEWTEGIRVPTPVGIEQQMRRHREAEMNSRFAVPQ